MSIVQDRIPQVAPGAREHRSGARPVRVLHVTTSASLVRGGVSAMLWNMLDTFDPSRVVADLVSTDDDGPDRRLTGHSVDFTEFRGHRVRYFARQSRFYAVSLPLAAWIARNVRNYDVVHIHGLFSFVPIVAAYHARRRGVPYVVTPHGMLDRWGRENRRPALKALSIRHIEGPLLRDASRVHFTCQAEHDQARELGLSLDSVVIPLGARLEHADAHPDATSAEPVVLFMARIDEKKGLDLLLDAFALVHREHPDARLDVAGDGASDLMERLRARAVSLGIADRVRWLGFVSGERKRATLAACRVFVLPCRADTFPVAVIEAMSAARPVVLSREAGIAPVVEQAGAGLVTDGSVASLARSIRRLLVDTTLAARMGRAGRDTSRNELSLERFADRLESLYRSVAPCTP